MSSTQPEPTPETESDPAPGLIVGRPWELSLVLVGGALVAAAWIGTMLDAPAWFMWGLCIASTPLTSPRTFTRAIEATRALRVDIDLLMFVAAIGASAIGQPIEGAFLLFLFGVGAVGEHLALRRAESSLNSLEALAPEYAERVAADGSVEHVALASIEPGDRIRVRPFERVPCDGSIVEGATAIDEATLTGEPIPVSKSIGDEVFAGTLNTGSAITITALRPASESALARVIRVVTEARSRRARVELLTERIARWYAPSVLVAAAVVFGLPTLLWGDAAEWFYRSMAFLTAASPCALAIGAPATYLCGIAAGARRGIVFKGGQSLEALALTKAIALDKTGTITTGHPRVHRIIAFDQTEDELLAAAAAVEAQASHPLADAIVAEANTRGLRIDEVSAVEQISGLGVQAQGPAGLVRVTSPKIIADQPGSARAAEAVHEIATSGATVIVVEIAGRIAGLIGMRDTVRPDAAETMAALTERGIRLVMITGDHEESARAIAAEVGITEIHAGQSPEGKLALIEQLVAEVGHVAMIGDGANDAPALARASVSLSMGGAASDVAADNADIAIMGERMAAILVAMKTARDASRIMRQNLVIALTVILVMAPLAVVGIADLGPAVIMHEGSTVVVVLNALRQLRKPRVRR